MLNQFADALRKSFRERSTMLSESMAAGAMKNYDEYKYASGVIHGLAEAERELNELMLAYTKGD